ncbi:phospholipase A2 [Nonomuraea africana]|uniref:phospholipase A2 n=1 Tax=Nonomuraea africana TaxID=46171 RepID=UPI00340B72C7
MRSSRRLAAACAFSALAVLTTTAVASAAPTPQPSSSPSSGSQTQTITERTETSTTYRLADGRTVTELHAGPIRVKRGDGNWADIDTDLIADGDGIRPKVVKGDVSFSAGGSGAFAQLRRTSGESVELGWDGQLPKPEIDGNKAIYRGVAADGAGDLVATALPAGLRFDVVLNRRPTGPVEIRVPVIGKGLTVAKAEGDRVAIKDGDEVIAASSTPALYDATSPHAYHPRNKQRPRSTPPGKGKVGEIDAAVTDTSGGKALLLKPSADFLADPATAYPVTVDPSVVLPLNNDTDVNSAFDGNNVSGGYLKAGTEADGEKARTYLRFDTRGLKTPTSAVLKLTNLDAPACGPTVSAGIQVRRITSHWDATTQTWAPQPTNTTEDAVISTEGSQLGACGSGTMTWNVTPIVTKWAAGTANHGLVLQSPTETAQTNYRVFAAAENTDELAGPVLEVTSDEIITPGEGDDPADPGPADFKPGRVEVETGSWITSGIDLTDDGLLITRSHSAGQRIDITQPNENVLGPKWRFEPLGGMLGNRLKDFSANGYIQINLTSGTESQRFTADAANPGTFVSAEGAGTVVKNTDGTFTQSGGDDGLVFVWSKVGTDYLITSLGSAEVGMTIVAYDAQGRVSRIAAPTTAQDNCAATSAPGCATATLQYATTTTATSTVFADVAGQLKTITFDAAGDIAPVTAASYAYDNLKRLRKVVDARQVEGEPIKTSTYTYDSSGNINRLSTAEEGTWNLTYSAPGKLATATEVTTAQPATFSGTVTVRPALYTTTATTQSATALALQSHCKYASQYLYGTNGCWVSGGVPMSYGGGKLAQRWKKTPGGKSVVGVTNDHCTTSVDRPGKHFVPYGFDFRVACDMHDYGYGIIYLSKTDTVWTKAKKGSVDSIFYTTLRDYTCNAYPVKAQNTDRDAIVYPREQCRRYASKYYLGVKTLGGIGM